MCCVITRSLWKHPDLTITEFLPKPYYFLKIVHLLVYRMTHLVKKTSYEIWNCSLGSTLQFALFKIKIRLLESDQKYIRHGSSTKPLLSLCKRDNTTEKCFGKINLLWNTGNLDKNNDVKHNIFCCLFPLIGVILL